MKRKMLLVALALVCVLTCAFGLVACDNGNNDKGGTGNNGSNGGDNKPSHTHTYSTTWTGNETHHWHPSTCGHDVISGKAEHIWDGGVVTKEPTCTEKGEKTYTCTVCDKTKKEEIAASGHTFSEAWESNETHHWHICLKDNCDEVSDKAAHTGNPCMVCGYENIPEHEHSLEYHAAKPVTCTENGNIEYWECTGCHKYFADEQGETEITEKNSVIIVTEGHKWGEWETVKQATCTEEGKKERQCSACTEKEHELLPALNHSYGEWQTIKEPTCTEEGKKERQCSACTEKEHELLPALNHIYGEWQTIKEPTCTEEGEKQRVCSRCSHSEIETLPVIAHTYDGYIKNAEYHWQKCMVCQNEGEREPHNFANGVCSVCNYDSRFSFELDFKLTGDYYTVTGMGDCTDKEIKIPESYEGKPVKAIAANAFWGNTDIISLNIPKSIESIGNNAFQNCTGLEKISIENKNIELGTGAFLGCEKISWASCPAFVVSEITITNLKDLIVTDGELENAVLSDAKNLVSLTVPDISTTLGAVFGANTNVLESLTLAETTEIAENAFKDFTALKEINLPEGIDSIGADAFLNTAYYNDASNWVFNVLYVDSYLLKANTQITGHYPINNETTVIADAAFSSCNGLTSIVISDNVKTIGNNAFENCSGLTDITIPASVTSIGEGAFSGCSNLIKIETDSENPNYFSQDGVLYNRKNTEFVHIPAKLQGNIVIADGIVSIFDNAFSGRSGLSSVIIPDSVTSIGSGAFEGCGGLTSITIPFVGGKADGSGATHFGYIFGASSYGYNDDYVPKSLKEVIITGGTSIGERAFYGCSGLTSITIPNSVTSIGSSAFRDCSGLTSITIPNSVTSIGSYAFYGCSGLISITIPNGVTSIGSSAFYNCSGLTSITIPESVTSIGEQAFYGCSGGLTSIIVEKGNAKYHSSGNCLIETGTKTLILGCQNSIIPNDGSVTSIRSSAFYYCSGLTSITIPESITSIGRSAFSGCSGLTSITIPFVGGKADGSGATHFGYIFGASSYGYNDDYVPKNLKEVIITGGTSIESSAFRYCSGLISITIPNGVTSIGSYAFYNCSGLTSVIIPDSVTSIGSGAFEGCSGLTSITIPFVGGKADGSGETHFGYIFGASYSGYNDDYVPKNLKEVIITGGTSIGYSAFYGCSSLTSITIPESVTSIEMSTFRYCSGLTSITIPDSVTSIGESAFSGCSGLTSVTIPESITSIGDYAFSGCSGLTSITIPESITSIGRYAFSGCSELTSITIPFVGGKADGSGATHFGYIFGAWSDSYNDDYVPKNLKEVIITGGTSIESSAFRYCSGLTSITIPNSVTSIGSSAFDGCSGLTSITIPESVTNIEMSTFSDCSGLTSITIPESVTSIGSSAFSGCSGLTSIIVEKGNTKYHSSGNCLIETGTKTLVLGCKNSIIPNDGSVTSIGQHAFLGCSGLTSITIPDSVTSIGYYAFLGCSGLTSITIPNSVTSIGSYAFYGCSGLTSVTIPESITSIGDSAFSGCSGLTSVTIPESVTSIGDRAFDGCSSLISIIIPDSVTRIGDSAFSGCSSLTSVTIPDSVTRIGDYAFGGCSGLTSITIPNSVTSIGSSAFRDCSGLTNVIIGNGVTSIGVRAFSDCSRLTSVTISDSVTSIGNYAFSGCSGLTNVIIGNGVTSIGNSAFRGCSSLISIIIPDSVTSIGDYAFSGCSGLTSITIPNSVTSIGYYAFEDCSGLTIYCEAESRPSGWDGDWNPDGRSVVWGYKNQ